MAQALIEDLVTIVLPGGESTTMRLVGNSYAVSIPKEIVSFMEHQEKIMDEMVRLCFEDFGRVSLNFGVEEREIENE